MLLLRRRGSAAVLLVLATGGLVASRVGHADEPVTNGGNIGDAASAPTIGGETQAAPADKGNRAVSGKPGTSLLGPGETCKKDDECAGLCDHETCRGTDKVTGMLIFKQKTGPSGFRIVAPFWYEHWTPTSEGKMFLPLFYQDRDEKLGRSRVLIPPFFRQTEEANHRAITVVGPFFRDSDDRGTTQAFLPLFYDFIDPKRQARTTLLFPILAIHTSPTSKFGYFGPAYGYRGDHGWAGGLFPVAMFGRDRDLRYQVVPPLFWHFQSDRQNTVIVGPGFYHRDLAIAGPDKEGFDAGVAPLLFVGRHADRRYFSLAGVVNVFTRKDSWTSVVGPLYLSSSGAKGYAYGLAPLFNFSRSESGTTQWLLPPLFIRWFNPDQSRSFMMVGPYFRSQEERGPTEGVFPLVWKIDRGPHHVRLALPFYARDVDDRKKTDFLQAGPYLRIKDGVRQSTAHVFLPLFFKYDEPNYHATVQFPFFWRVQQKDETDTVAFPLYYRIRKPDLAADVFFPLVWRFGNPLKDTSTTVAGPFYYHHTPDGNEGGLLPIAGWGSRPEKKAMHVWIGPLAFYHGHDESAQTSRTVFLSFFLDKNKQNWTSALIPLFGGGRRDNVMRWVAPLSFHSQDDTKGTALTFLTLAFWGHNQNRSYGGLFPLFYHFGNYKDGRWSTTLFPLFHIAKKSDGGLRLITPLFGAFTSPTGTRAFVGPLYVRKAEEGYTAALFPIFYHAHENKGTTTSFFIPLFLRRATPETSLLAISPLFWRYKSVESTTNLFFPFVLDRDVHFESHTSVFAVGVPLFVRHVNYATDTKSHFALLPLPFLYRTAPAERMIVVFPLFWHVRTGNDWSQLALPFYLHLHRESYDYTVVANLYFKTGHGEHAGAWSFHFFPIFNFGRPHPGDWEWGIFGGLIGYNRTGRRRTLKLIWSYEVPLAPAAQRIAPPPGGGGSGGSTPSSLDAENIFF